MNWGKIWKAIRTWWLVAVTIAGGVGLAFLPLFIASDPEPQKRLYVFLALSAVAAGVGPILDRLRANRREKQAAQKWEKARANLNVAFTETIPPNLAGIVEILNAKVLGVESTTDLVTRVLHHCRAFLTTDGVNVRANYYRLQGEGKRAKLSRADMTGGNSRSEFTQTAKDAEGRVVVQAIQSSDTVFCGDVTDPDEIARLNLDPDRERDYASFLSVPVESDGRVYGMLSVNALSTGVLEESSGSEMLKLMGKFIVVAETLKNLPAATGPQLEGSV